jgi:hypothetical protein
MPDKVRISDPHGILQEFNPDAPKMVEAKPDIAANLARIDGRVEKATYLEPYFFHPDQAVQACVAAACVPIDVGKVGDYLINVLATATHPATLTAAATAVWKREEAGTGGIDGAVDSLRAYLHSIGRPKARQIVELLLKHAPNAQARTELSNAASTQGENLLA